jgi:hypothetical protein
VAPHALLPAMRLDPGVEKMGLDCLARHVEPSQVFAELDYLV